MMEKLVGFPQNMKLFESSAVDEGMVWVFRKDRAIAGVNMINCIFDLERENATLRQRIEELEGRDDGKDAK